MAAPDAVARFIATWRASTLKERGAAQSHFNQLCELPDVVPPVIADPRGEWFTFPRPELRRKLAGLTRYIATSETAKHRVFIWLPVSVAPEHKLVVIVRDDDETFGILSSRFHVVWATALGGGLGVGKDPVYNSTRCFETFPFPPGLQPNRNALTPTPLPEGEGLKAAIAVAARRLDELRENWLNPLEWVEWVPEVVSGYPDRLIPRPEHATELKKRTLPNLYNQRSAWLIDAHRTLDEAVAAHGWPADLNDEEVLRRLLTLNHERVGRGSAGRPAINSSPPLLDHDL